jgi:hypothetical protein
MYINQSYKQVQSPERVRHIVEGIKMVKSSSFTMNKKVHTILISFV